MGVTVDAARERIRWGLGDHDPSDYAITSPALNLIIAQQAPWIASKIGLHPEWHVGAVPIVAGTRDYQLPAVYAQPMIFRLVSKGWALARVPMPDMDALYRSPAMIYGVPTHYTLWENPSGELWLRTFPNDTENDTLDIYAADLPPTVVTGATVLPFDQDEQIAFELHVMACAAGRLGPDALAKLNLGPAAVEQFRAEAAAALKAAQLRILKQKRVSGVARREA